MPNTQADSAREQTLLPRGPPAPPFRCLGPNLVSFSTLSPALHVVSQQMQHLKLQPEPSSPHRTIPNYKPHYPQAWAPSPTSRGLGLSC